MDHRPDTRSQLLPLRVALGELANFAAVLAQITHELQGTLGIVRSDGVGYFFEILLGER
jgi:hypothetical protein